MAQVIREIDQDGAMCEPRNVYLSTREDVK